jgi:hypothetical protein
MRGEPLARGCPGQYNLASCYGDSALMRSGEHERRSDRRYAIQADLGYQVVIAGHIADHGCGRTLNLSSSGVLFESARGLPLGALVKISISWPVRLNEHAMLMLCVEGQVVRSGSRLTAVELRRYEFRVRKS